MQQVFDKAAATDIAGSSGGAVFIIDGDLRIIAWNRGAERLLGFQGSDALGQQCYEMLDGRDVRGNAYCSANCPLRSLLNRKESVAPFEIVWRDAAGNDVHTSVTTLAIPIDDDTDAGVVHVLQEPPSGSDLPRCVAAREGLDRLTDREIEVLRYIAEGYRTEEMAQALFIGVATVRHHIQSILCKLGVHSRVEAAAVFHRSRIEPVSVDSEHDSR